MALVGSVGGLVVGSQPASAADVLVVSNNYFNEAAADMQANTAHNVTGWDAAAVPTAIDLAPYDVVLLFQDGGFVDPVGVGNALHAYIGTGGNVVMGTFYWQGRSDGGGVGWGALETVDPMTAAAGGSEYLPDTLNVATMVAHPMTAGLLALSAQEYRGGTTAKADAVILAEWTGTNQNGLIDPLIAYRTEGNACVVGVSIAPHYSTLQGLGNGMFAGDFFLLWDNVLQSASVGCGDGGGVCGDGEIGDDEECDDANKDETDDCIACANAFCGDGFVQMGLEQCDDANKDDTDDCIACADAVCGDGLVQAGVEECDDANEDDDDECANDCTLPVAGTTSDDAGSSGDGDTGSAETGSADGDTDSSGGAGTSGGADGASADDTGDGATGGADGSASAGVSAGSETGGLTGTGTSAGGDGSSDDDGGCGCNTRHNSPGWLVLGGVVLLGFRRRRTVATLR